MCDGIEVPSRGGLRHELSIPAMEGTVFGLEPASNVSMTIMRPLQHGHGDLRTFGSSGYSGSCVSGSFTGAGTASSSLARAMLAVRLPLASNP